MVTRLVGLPEKQLRLVQQAEGDVGLHGFDGLMVSVGHVRELVYGHVGVVNRIDVPNIGMIGYIEVLLLTLRHVRKTCHHIWGCCHMGNIGFYIVDCLDLRFGHVRKLICEN